MISVLHVITGLDTGGAENNLVRLATRMSRETFTSSVLCLTTAGPRARDLAEAGVPVTALGMSAGRPGPVAAWRLFDTIRTRRPSILQTWLPHSDLLGQLAGSAAGAPTICWNIRHSTLDPADHPASLFWVLRALAWLSPRPACVVANSMAGRRAAEAIGYHPRRWEVIPNGFDVDRFSPSPLRRAALRVRLGVADEVPLVGLVGRYHPMKDHRTFIDAAALVHQTRPDARFLLVGRGIGPGNRELTAQLTRADLVSSTHLQDECDDAASIFPALDLLVSSSYSEALPNVVGEAMACGVPCVVTDAGDSASLVGSTGVVVPPRDPVALADGMLRLLAADPQSRSRLGEAARERIVADYSLALMVERYEGLYSELAGRALAVAGLR